MWVVKRDAPLSYIDTRNNPWIKSRDTPELLITLYQYDIQ